jgi:hypothetical protein
MTLIGQLIEALSYAVATSLMLLGLCVVAAVAIGWAVRR